MGRFLLGFLTGVLLCVVGGVALFFFRPWQVHATAEPSALERALLEQVLHKAVERDAPKLQSPYPANDENLLEGLKLYRMGCAGCHGGASRPSQWGTTSFYPRPPQFGIEPTHFSDAEAYWVIQNGIRYTGMGAWKNISSDEEIWKVAMFVSRMRDLPDSVAAEWKRRPSPVSP